MEWDDGRADVRRIRMQKIALALYKWCCVHRWGIFSDNRVEHALGVLHPGENRLQLSTDYYVGKLARSMWILLCGIGLAILFMVKGWTEGRLGEDLSLERGKYGQGSKDVILECELPEGKEEFCIQLEERRLTRSELEQLSEEFCAVLPQLIRMDGMSFCLEEHYDGYPFSVVWRGDASGIVETDGTIHFLDHPVQVELTVGLTYFDWYSERMISVEVLPPKLSDPEIFRNDLARYLKASEEESRQEAFWKLPASWQGQALRWKKKQPNTGGLLLLGSFVTAVVVFGMADRDLQTQVECRKRKMKKCYPDIVHKLALYLGAGFSIRGAMHTIAKECRDGPAYEEILYTCRELDMGTSEPVAYEHLGRRVGLREYIRLSGLLCQNLKKGSNELLQCLQEEAAQARNEQLRQSRKLGEEASTKLLLPMVMILLMVMLMIMMPAFLSMTI